MWRARTAEWSLLKVACVASLLGCGAGPQVRASRSMLSRNPIERVAIFGEAQVVWPRFRKGEYFGLSESKQSLTAQIPKVQSELRRKGYDVVYAEPAAVGYFAPWMTDRLVSGVVEEKGVVRDDPDTFVRCDNKEPLFEYPAATRNLAVRDALRRIFESLEESVSLGWGSTFTLDPDDVVILRDAAGADTICLARITGRVFTTARKIGTVVEGIAVGVALGGAAGAVVAGGASDSSGISLLLVDANSGDVLFLGEAQGSAHPSDEKSDIAQRALALLPSRGKALDAKYRKPDGP